MKTLQSWLIVMFMAAFWIFRVIIAVQAQYQKDFGGFIAFNFNVEIALLFITLVCMILVLRRFWIGGLIYFASYGYYFGGYLFANLAPTQNALAAAIGLVIAICVFVDLTIEKAMRRAPKETKTDWYFKDEKYDREYDERADKNQYRNY